jgi:hypothetical protein
MMLWLIMSEDIPLRKPVNALVSYHYFKKHDIGEMRSWGLRLIGDSGAFSSESQGVEIDIDDFATWGHKWREDLCWLASLDVIGNKEASWANYKYLRGAGLDVIPTIHYGCDPKEMDRYIAEGIDFIGLGGMVGRKSEQDRLLRWTLSIFRYARDNHPQMRFHGWGTTHNKLIMSLPWYSVDSSGFSASYRFGRLTLFDPSTGKNVAMALDGKDVYNHTDLIRNEYGIDPSEIAVSNRETRRQVVRISVAAIQRTEDFLRKRHSVTPPKYGLQDIGDDQLSIHAALGFPGAQAAVSLNPADIAPSIVSNIHIAADRDPTAFSFTADDKDALEKYRFNRASNIHVATTSFAHYHEIDDDVEKSAARLKATQDWHVRQNQKNNNMSNVHIASASYTYLQEIDDNA